MKDEAPIVKCLLLNNADVVAENAEGGDTPLHLASAYNKVGAAVAIMEVAPLAASHLNHDGDSPLELAKNKKMKIVLKI